MAMTINPRALLLYVGETYTLYINRSYITGTIVSVTKEKGRSYVTTLHKGVETKTALDNGEPVLLLDPTDDQTPVESHMALLIGGPNDGHWDRFYENTPRVQHTVSGDTRYGSVYVPFNIPGRSPVLMYSHMTSGPLGQPDTKRTEGEIKILSSTLRISKHEDEKTQNLSMDLERSARFSDLRAEGAHPLTISMEKFTGISPDYIEVTYTGLLPAPHPSALLPMDAAPQETAQKEPQSPQKESRTAPQTAQRAV